MQQSTTRIDLTVFMTAGMAAMWHLDAIVTVVEVVGGSCLNLSWGIWQPRPKDLRAPIPCWDNDALHPGSPLSIGTYTIILDYCSCRGR